MSYAAHSSTSPPPSSQQRAVSAANGVAPGSNMESQAAFMMQQQQQQQQYALGGRGGGYPPQFINDGAPPPPSASQALQAMETMALNGTLTNWSAQHPQQQQQFRPPPGYLPQQRMPMPVPLQQSTQFVPPAAMANQPWEEMAAAAAAPQVAPEFQGTESTLHPAVQKESENGLANERVHKLTIVWEGEKKGEEEESDEGGEEEEETSNDE